eukprot:5738447-Ditylum_brightwellii.AAC.1
MDITIPTKWVKGHQDEKKEKGELKWEEELNIRAVELANYAQGEITTNDRNETVELLPACNAHLLIKGKPITSKIMPNMRDAWSKVALRKDYKKQFQWKTKDFNNINWSKSG